MTPDEYYQANSDPITGEFTGSFVEWTDLIVHEAKQSFSRAVEKAVMFSSPNVEWDEYFDEQLQKGETCNGWLAELDRLKNG